jgi:hypothetical protein
MPSSFGTVPASSVEELAAAIPKPPNDRTPSEQVGHGGRAR